METDHIESILRQVKTNEPNNEMVGAAFDEFSTLLSRLSDLEAKCAQDKEIIKYQRIDLESRMAHAMKEVAGIKNELMPVSLGVIGDRIYRHIRHLEAILSIKTLESNCAKCKSFETGECLSDSPCDDGSAFINTDQASKPKA